MKKILITAAFAAIAVSAFSFDSEKIVPKGKVNSYSKTDYSVTSKFGEYFRTPDAKYVHVFDQTGLEIESSEYSPKDVLIDKITYGYDVSRNLISETCSDGNGNLLWKSEYSYQTDGKLKDVSTYDAGGVLTGKKIYKNTANEEAESVYNADGALVSKTITKTDERGRSVTVNKYFADGSLESSKNCTYNDAGALAQTENIGADGKIVSRTLVVYDDKAFVKEIQEYDGEGNVTQRAIYKNEVSGNPIKVTTYSVSEKFGGTVNELIDIVEYVYK